MNNKVGIIVTGIVTSVLIFCITVLLAIGRSSEVLVNLIVALPGVIAAALSLYNANKTTQISSDTKAIAINVNGHLTAALKAAGVPPVDNADGTP